MYKLILIVIQLEHRRAGLSDKEFSSKIILWLANSPRNNQVAVKSSGDNRNGIL